MATKKSNKPKSGSTKRSQQKRRRISRPYPRVSLEEALRIVLAIKEKNGGNPWPPEDVAKALETSKNTTSFFYAAAAARDFGLTEGSRDTATIALTDLGRDVAYARDAESEKKAKIKAFLNVEIFRRVLEYYKGADLPEMQYLSNTLQRDFGLDPETHEEFSRLFRQNCDYLGIGSGLDNREIESLRSGRPEILSEVEPETKAGVVTVAEPEQETGLTCFVIMPFVERDSTHPQGFFAEVLRSLISPAGRKAGFTVSTANRQGSDVIQSTIINDLLSADLVIADLTEHNPNVLFELGMRMANDKPVALIRAKGTSPIFDVDNMLRVYEYDPNLWSTTVKRDLPRLTEHIKATWKNKDSDKSYLRILRQQGGTKKSGEE